MIKRFFMKLKLSWKSFLLTFQIESEKEKALKKGVNKDNAKKEEK